MDWTTVAPKAKRTKQKDGSQSFFDFVGDVRSAMDYMLEMRCVRVKKRCKKITREAEEHSADDPLSEDARWTLGAVIATGLSVVPMVPAFAGPTGVAMALCPPLLDVAASFRNFPKLVSMAAPNAKPWAMETHKRGVLVATFLQGSFGLIRMSMGDIYGGIYAILLATLGYNSLIPGPAANWLKTYVLITFINGTVGVVDLFQQTLVMNYPVLSLALPLSVNAAHFLTLAVPIVSFSGAYFGWEYIKAQKEVLVAMRQRELQMQQPGSLPWPPPPLPPPEVLQQMQRAMDKAAGICPTMRVKINQELEEQEEQLAKLREESMERQRLEELEKSREEPEGGLGLCS
eukprot:GEMP01038437.1.p1 GENE.GEMP01038437.1~~GEMP01038437.1.p1  ORF type:complete len:345 (+),score=83.14 GEMP01038437.1:182-1216(+)